MSEREKKLLVLVGVLFFVVIYYYLAYVPLTNKLDIAESENSNLTAQLNVLNMDVIRKDEYIKGTKEAGAEIQGAELLLPPALPQELIIKSITDIEANVPDIEIPTFTLGLQETTLFSDNSSATQTTSDATISAATDPSTSAAAIKVAPTESGIAVIVGTTITTKYESFKQFLKYLQTYPIRVSIKGLSLTSDQETGDLSATFTLTWYGLQSTDRTITDTDYFGPYSAKKNSIFEPISKFSTTTTSTTTTAKDDKEDFFIILDPITSDGTTVIIGKTGDPQGQTYARADKNAVENIEIEFYQSGSTYYYHYKTSSESYPASYSSGAVFTPGNAIEIQLISSDRTSADDLSGANATIINKTDIPVNIVKFSEDQATPRLKIVKTEGLVNAN